MEVSPAKSLEIVSDSEGEDGTRSALDMLAYPNAARLSGPRDWHTTHNAATIATNPSSHISQFSTPLLGQPPAMATGNSSIQMSVDSDWSATKTRPRVRPRMRPVPPPDDVESSSIGTFSALQPVMTGTTPGTIASFDNSAVQVLPAARPPSLPPSSLPAVSSSSSVPAPTFPVSPREKTNPKSVAPTHNATSATSSGAIPATTMDQPAPSAPKRRPRMRPPPLPEPEVLPKITNTTTSSTATTTSSSNANASTSTGVTSSAGTHADAPRRSALDDAEEYTGRGARRLAQHTKSAPIHSPNSDVDVGGPEDVINLISDGEYSESKTTSKSKAKPNTKSKKKVTSKAGSIPAQSNVPNERTSSSASGPSKRKSPQPQSSDDEFGRWDASVPGASRPMKRKKMAIAGSDDEDMSATRPTFPAHIPNTIDPPLNPPAGPSDAHVSSSPLTSPGRSSPKRKDPPDSPTVPSPTKRSRRNANNVLVGVVLGGPAGDENGSKKTKTRRKKTTKAAAVDDTIPSTLGPQELAAGDEQAYVPPALISAVDTSSSGLQSESNKTKTTPPTSSGAPAQPPADPEKAQDLAAPVDVEPAPVPTKKQPKKRATKGKKGAAAVDPAPTDEQEAPKKGAKGKNKAKAKEAEPVVDVVASDAVASAAGASSSNPDAGATATSSNPSAAAGPAPASSNSSAPNQTPAPKSTRPKPRHSTTPAPLPVAMGASGALLRSAGSKSADRPLSETIRLTLGGSGTPTPRVGLSRRGSSKIAPLLAFRGVPPPPPPPMPKKPTRKKKGESDDEDSEEGSEWEGLTEKQKEKKRREKEMAGWYSDG